MVQHKTLVFTPIHQISSEYGQKWSIESFQQQ